MEMSPKAIAAVTFPVVRKGYDPEQVRSFLSQLSRGVEELQNRALQAEAKARLSSAPAAESANVESITKTLLLAQRTADSTLAEARDEAEGIRRQASERAEAILAEAKAQGAQLISAAEQEAVRSGDAARARVTAEVEALEARRQALLQHSDALSNHVTAQRERLAATVEVLQRALDQPDGLQDLPRPEAPESVAPASVRPPDPWAPATNPPVGEGAATPEPAPPNPPSIFDQPAGGFPAPSAAVSVDPITQEVPTVGEREPQAWSSFWEEGPSGDDRWKR
jgi:DivIVA domain-containing protein